MLGTGVSLSSTPVLASGKPWFRRLAELLDGVAPGFYLDAYNQRHALNGAVVPLSSLLTVTNASAIRTYIDPTGVMQTAPANTPRIDWTSGKPELLLEGASTNLCLFSTDPTNASHWSTSAISRTYGIADPALGVNASRATCTAIGAPSFSTAGYGGISFVAGTTYTLSRFVRAGTQALVQLTGTSSAFGVSQYANFDLSSGTVGSYTGCSPSITRIGAWWRVSITLAAATTTVAAGSVLAFITSLSSGRAPAVTLTTYFDEAFPQVEAAGAPTSYIPTTSTAVTRTADLCQLSAPAASASGMTAWAWRGSAASAFTSQQFMAGTGGSYIRDNAPSEIAFSGHTALPSLVVSSGVIPGPIAFCGGWGASGRRASNAGSAPVADTAVPDRSRTAMFLGPSTGLATGQILRIRQLVGWALPDRPSSAGVQAQARAAA